MERWVRFFIERPLLVYLISILIVFAGFLAMTSMRRQVFPEASLQQLQVETLYPAASARDVEINVTIPLEEKILEVDGIDKVRSVSMENYSLIRVTLDPDAPDEDRVKDEVRRAVDQVADLPAEVTERPRVMDLETSWIPVVVLGLSGDTLDERHLRSLAVRLEHEIEALPGVSRVDTMAYRDPEIQVRVSPDRLRETFLSLDDVALAIQQRNVRLTGGTLESFRDSATVLTLAEFDGSADVGEAIVRSNFEGRRILVRDLARLEDGFEKSNFRLRMNGVPVIGLRVHKKQSADAIRTMQRLRRTLDEARATLPPGLRIHLVEDSTQGTLRRLHILRNNALLGFVFVVAILIVFLNLRVALWTSLGIPIALSVGFLAHSVTGGTIDSVSLTAFILVLGMLVDDAIVVAENFHRYREAGLAPMEAAVKGVTEVAGPVAATVGTTVVAFLPLYSMGGTLAPFITMIPVIVAGTLLGSLLESFFILPSHLSAHRRHAPSWRERGALADPWFKPLQALYRRLLGRVLAWRYLLIGASVIVLAATAYLATHHMKFVLFPQEAAEAVILHVETPKGCCLEATEERVASIETLLAGLPKDEVEFFESWVGRDQSGTHEEMMGDNLALIYLGLTPYGDRKREATAIVGQLKQATDALAGQVRVSYQIDTGGPPVGRAVELNLVGDDPRALRTVMEEVTAYLRTVPGVLDPDSDLKYARDEELVRLDYAELARLGLTVSDVARTVRLALEGEVVSQVRFTQEEVGIRVMLDGEHRRADGLLDLVVRNRAGNLVPLRRLVRLQRQPALQGIRHYQGQRVITVSADVDTDRVTSGEVADRIRERFADLPRRFPGVRLVIGGEAAESEKTMRNLLRAASLAVMAIYFILVLLLNSLVQPLIILLSIPLGAIGVILAFWAQGMTLGFLALVGMLGMAGVVVNDSIVILSFINHLGRERGETGRWAHATILDAAQTRLRPVLLTTLTTVFALLPTAYGFGGSDIFVAPMVMAMLWGLLFGSGLTLFWVPTLFAIGQDLKIRKSKTENRE